MPFEVEVEGLPQVLEFEDGTPDEVVRRVVRQEAKNQAATEGAAAQASVDRWQTAEDFVRGFTPQGLQEASAALPKVAAHAAGWALNYLGGIAGGLAEDLMEGNPQPWRAAAAAMGQEYPVPSPAQGPVSQGLVDAAKMAPTVAAGSLAMAYGVPPAIAFGGPMAVQAYDSALEHGADEQQAAMQAAQAGATGAVIPGVGRSGAEFAAKALGQAVQRGLLSSSRTAIQKGVEVMASQGAIQAFVEGMNLPEYLAASPEDRGKLLTRHLAANIPFLMLDVPNVLNGSPSRTQAGLVAKVGDIMAKVAQDPEASKAFREAVDEEAVQQLAEQVAQNKETIPPVIEATQTEPTTGPATRPETKGGDSVEGQAQGQEEVLSSPMPGAALATPVAPGTLPASLLPRAREAIQIETVRERLADVVRSVGGEPVFRSRRFRQRALGVFKVFPGVIRMRDMNDLSTLSHEVAHQVDQSLWGQAGGVRRNVPAAVSTELRQLGVALYGRRRPAGGYTSEGWAEFWRYFLTTDEARAEAPATTDWFERTFLPANPRAAEAVGAARHSIDNWRSMDPMQRIRSQQRPHQADVDQDLARLRRAGATFQGLFEAGAPLADLARTAEALTGRPLNPVDNPWLLFDYHRGRGGHVVETMMSSGMVDIFDRPTGGRSLAQELAPVTARVPRGMSKAERIRQFWDFMYARIARESWARGQNPGISREVADSVFNQLGADPDFQLAATGYDQWWQGVRDYVRSASPNMAALMDAFEGPGARAGYAPLARVVERELKQGGGAFGPAGSSNPARRFRGSARAVREIQTQTALSAERLVNAAHREQVLDAIYRLATTVPGLGRLIERIPPEMRANRVSVGRLRTALEAEGINTSAVPDDTILTYYQASQQPHGTEPIIIRKQPSGQAEWYSVSPELFDAVAGMRPMDLGPVASLLLDKFARLTRLGSTALRPAFGWVTNPSVDLPTALMQSRTAANPLGFLRDYLGSIHEMALHGITGRASPALQQYLRSGVSGSTFLGGDIRNAQRAGRNLFHGRAMRTVTSPVEAFRELVSFFENAPRLTEYKRVARDAGWTGAGPIPPEAQILAAVAASEITTNFRARGDFGGDSFAASLMRGTSFGMAALQGLRTFGRRVRLAATNPMVGLQVAAHGTALVLLPTIANWWKNKDKEWYRALPAAERYNYWNIELGNGEVLQVRKPREWGTLFGAIPEALLDRAFLQDPDATAGLVKAIEQNFNPFDIPALAKTYIEQVSNRIQYFDKPIVPRSQEDKLPGAQVAPYSSALAVRLGELFPELVSPRRVDHLIRAIGGGAAADAMAALGLQKRAEQRGLERTDIPVFGRLWRRGGISSGANRWLEHAYDAAAGWERHLASRDRYPMTPEEIGKAKAVTETVEAIRTIQQLIELSPDPQQRRSAYGRMTPGLRRFYESMKSNNMLPENRKLPAPVEPQERLKAYLPTSQPSSGQPQ